MWYSIRMDGNQKHHRVKKMVILSIIILTGVLFVLVVNLLRLQQISTRSRASAPKTILVPTPSISLIVTSCGNLKVNCNLLKPNVTVRTTESIIPLDKPGDVINMECMLSQSKTDAQCAYKLKDTQATCLTGIAYISVGAGSTTNRCLGVKYDQINTSRICRITELFQAGGIVPSSEVDCQKLLITPTVTQRIQAQ